MSTKGGAATLADLSWLRRSRSVSFVTQLLVSLPLVVVTVLLLGGSTGSRGGRSGSFRRSG
ncbi:hypothetical protein ACFYO1_13170 [Nocardia sp. NPDC006044]|uniref:hypothetical protein n=1 Tax=Nocardia sp. NPDC006044 TaxID=3364306 RepID=UPI00367C0E10